MRKLIVALISSGVIIALMMGVMPVISLATTPPPYEEIEAIDTDFDGDGEVGLSDFVEFTVAYGSVGGDSDYAMKADMDFDDDVDLADFVEFATLHKGDNTDLAEIEAAVKTGTIVALEWEDGFRANLQQVDVSALPRLIGSDNGTVGWFNLRLHPNQGIRYCGVQFSADLRNATYRALGYGVILEAHSDRYSLDSQFYNIVYGGNNWRELSSWYIVEAETGWIKRADLITQEHYKVQYIKFPKQREEEGAGIGDMLKQLKVDQATGTVSYETEWISGHAGTLENSYPPGYVYDIDRGT